MSNGGPMRDGFAEIVNGWTLIGGMDDLTDRIERAAEWTKANGPLLPSEEATIRMMIQCQIERGMFGEDMPGDAAGDEERSW
jgi:hypothetical protein